MKRSEVNRAIADAITCFKINGWILPPEPRWDVTDFGLQDFSTYGLVLVNLAEEPEYCEKLMYAVKDQVTPLHMHKKKKEDIICRAGTLRLTVWQQLEEDTASTFPMKVNGQIQYFGNGEHLELQSGERLTITPGIYHEFKPLSEQCIIGEVSTANDDAKDNFFINTEIGRFSEIAEDEPALYRLVSDKIAN